MNFRKLVEGIVPITSPPEHVFLLHGTSSGKLDRIKADGLKPPKGDVRDYMMGRCLEILKYFDVYEVPELVQANIDMYIRDTRRNYLGVSTEEDRCIYATVSMTQAMGYAAGLAEQGSEARQVATNETVYWLKNTKGVGEYELGDLRTPFLGGTPLILGFLVPVKDTSIPPLDWEGNVEAYLHRNVMERTFQQVYGRTHNGEVRVYREIPPSEIVFGVGTSGDEYEQLILANIGF